MSYYSAPPMFYAPPAAPSSYFAPPAAPSTYYVPETWIKIGGERVYLNDGSRILETRLAPAVDWSTGLRVEVRIQAGPWSGIPRKR